MNHSILSQNLKQLRLEKNYTQEQVADHLGVSPQSISRWECGNTLPDVMLLPEISRLYGVTVDDLFLEDILAYPNYAQRLLAIYEATKESSDFIRAEMEFHKILSSCNYTNEDLRCVGTLYHYMVRSCTAHALQYYDMVDISSDAYHKTQCQKMLLLSEIGQSHESVAIQEKAFNEDSADSKQWVRLIASYYHAKQYEKALSKVKTALSHFPTEAELYYYAGEVCQCLHNYEDAFEFWNNALSKDENFLDALYSIGYCYEELKNYEEAYKTWIRLANELEQKGFHIEKKIPLQLANKCAQTMQ